MMNTPPAPPRSGFSLVELLVVIAIMAILAGVVAMNVMHHPSEAKVKAAQTQLKILHTAIVNYSIDQDEIPTLQQGLDALVRKPTVPPIPNRYPVDGYLESTAVPKDPWGNDYIYLVPSPSGRSFEILSYGSDGEVGGVDDAADLSSIHVSD